MILPGNVFEIGKSISFDQIKLTVSLVLFNFFIYALVTTAYPPQDSLYQSYQKIGSPNTLAVAQSIYLQSKDPIEKVEVQKNLSKNPYLFISDQIFWKKLQNRKFEGDQVQITKIKDIFVTIEKLYKKSPQYQLGLSEMAVKNPRLFWPTWFTYQFVHFDLLHIVLNMLFLFLICSVLENLVSYRSLLAVYVFGGISGGLLYISMSDAYSVAVVGASGSICALMMYLAVLKGRQNIPWSFWLSPQKGFHGTIYLPALLIFPIFLLSDFVSVLVNGQSVGQAVSYSAHVGGALCGLVMALYERRHHSLGSETTSHGVFSHDDGL